MANPMFFEVPVRQFQFSPFTKENSMLQKLENAYLAILRFVVIAVAGVLLVAALILGINSFKAVQLEPMAKEITPQVSEQELIQGITKKPTVPQPQSESHNVDENTKKIDPNAAFYERASNAISTFVTKYSGGTESVDKAQVVEIIKKRAESLNDPKLVSAFAKGFADSIEKTLIDPSVIKIAQTTSPVDVVNEALSLFTQKFHEQIEKANAEFAVKQQEYIEKKAEGIQSLYFAAGTFVAFLMVVFLSVIIRIERNLRHLENRPVRAN
jgi:hypothetical protein